LIIKQKLRCRLGLGLQAQRGKRNPEFTHIQKFWVTLLLLRKKV